MEKNRDKEKVVCCGTFDNEQTAYMAKGILKNEGIDSMIENANFSSLFPVGIPGISGVRLLVFESDYPAAEALIKQSGLLTE